MSDTADEKFAAVQERIEKEHAAAKAALYEETSHAKEKAVSRLK
jgi:hypothetical protein